MGILGNLLGKAAERYGSKLGAMGGRGLHAIAGGKGSSARDYAKTGASVGQSIGSKVGGFLRKIPFRKGGIVKRHRMKRTKIVRRRR